LTYLTPILVTLVAWWLCTGILLFLNKLPTSTHKWSLLGVTILFICSLSTLQSVAGDASRWGAILSFLQALAIWAWLETTYLMGALTGVSKEPCPAGSTGWNRFTLAVKTSIHHELAVIVTGIVVIAITWGSPNHFAALTYLILWSMRWSAKLNLFLGVANVNEDWFPAHMRYLASYIRRRRMNLLFPFSITLATLMAGYWISVANNALTLHEKTGYTLAVSLLALAILEHLFLILSLRDSTLWAWALKAASRYTASETK
jgi:putative photosynthetic complex assembly protein 2